MFLPSTELYLVWTNHWNWESASIIRGGESSEILRAGDLYLTGQCSGADIFKDWPQVLGSQLKHSSSECRPWKVGSQPQRRDCCVSISLSEALGWSECKISVELILHSDPFIFKIVYIKIIESFGGDGGYVI